MNTQKISDLKLELKNELNKQAIEWLETEDGQKLKESFNSFCDDPYIKGSYQSFNECGDYVSGFYYDDGLDIDRDIFSEVIAILTEDNIGYILPNKDQTMTFEVSLGEPVVVNFSDRRHCYAIHSHELKLKTNYSELIGDDDSEKMNHAIYLIELAMRKHGCFPAIVEVDYYGGIVKELSTSLGTLTDKELSNYGNQFEESAVQS